MSEKYLMKGNEALAEASIRNGCKHFFGYPITPQTEISAYLSKKLPKIDGVFLQAESEISAINMVLGASACGVRALTSSSSPGISLKSETISYIAGCDLPCVIVNVMRGGPGLGGIQPSQADYWQATKALGHGDFHLLVFAPSSVQEIVDLVGVAFDLSDEYRMPAMILLDGILGQMMEVVTFPEIEYKISNTKKYATTGTKNNRPPNIINSLMLNPEELEKSVVNRFAKYDIIKEKEVRYDEYFIEESDLIIVSYGATARICKTVVDQARLLGLKVGMFRPITLYPFPEKKLNLLAKKVDKMLVVEMSMGQMVDDVKLATKFECDIEFLGRTGGIVPNEIEILDRIKKIYNDLIKNDLIIEDVQGNNLLNQNEETA